jgi:cytochrome c551/c552
MKPLRITYQPALAGLTFALTLSACGGESTTTPRLPCEVQRVLSQNCQGCHQQPTRYGAPMALLTHADLHAGSGDAPMLERVATRIADSARPMPPPPNPALSDVDRAVLEDWIAAGGPAAEPGDGEACALGETKPSAVYADPETPPEECEHFYEFRAHGDQEDEPWPLPANVGNDGNRYMCFYFSSPWEADQKAQWLHSQVDNSQVLHHWILYGTERLPAPSGSFQPCTAVQAGANFIAGWAPGGGDFTLPSNVEMDLPSGPRAGVILEVHYFSNNGQSAVDRSGVKLCTARRGTRPELAGVHTTGSEGICVPPGDEQVIEGLCSPRKDRGDIHVIGAWPHMHKLGRHMTITVVRADGREEVMHDRPFDFTIQEYHPFAQDEWILHPGDRLRTECTFFNAGNQSVPFGERTQDEMCYGFITSWPAGALENDPSDLLQLVGGPFQQGRRCLNPVSILQSCNGINDFPTVRQ